MEYLTQIDVCFYENSHLHPRSFIPIWVGKSQNSFQSFVKLDLWTQWFLEVERTVRCSRTVRFLVMFGRFEVRFLAKITCSDMFEVRFWWFWKILGPFFINKVREQFGFWWCSRGSKFGFGPKWDVQMCSKFDPLRFGMFEVRFFDVRSTSTNYLPTRWVHYPKEIRNKWERSNEIALLWHSWSRSAILLLIKNLTSIIVLLELYFVVQ